MPEGQVRSVLTEQLGDYESRFRDLDLSPMAAASIGQVHRAVTHDGIELAVKIQYPGVAESIDSDVDNLRSLLSLARLLPGQLDVEAITRAVKEELHREVDYERELQQLEKYRRALGERPGLMVPRGVAALSSARVLSMERAPGIELLEWAKTASAEERDRIGLRLLDLLLLELFETGLMQTDPNPANYLYDAPTDRLVLLDFGAAREVPEHVRVVYRQAFLALADADRGAVAAVLEALGVKPKAGSPALELLIELSLEAAEAFTPGPYDFGSTDLSERLQVRGRALARHQQDLKSPPPEFIFFQRKLGGTFLLCRQLRARVDCHALLVRHRIIG
jgi:predicted unusual protein kinase regulating ubiquinone biosynthesis (AarF/ABC1/UbiB family)